MASRLVLKFRVLLAVLALALPPLALISLGLGLLLFDRGVLGLESGAIWLGVSAVIGAASLFVLLVGRSAGWVAWRWMVLLALPSLAPIGVAAYAADWWRRHPSLAEISTDFVDPPAFGGKASAVGPGVADRQKQMHPALRAITLSAQPDQAYEQALSLAKAQGWTITSAGDGVIEGYGVFGRFKDRRDWVMRIRPDISGGSLVDMRLKSRTDTPDFGHNGEVVGGFLKRLQAEAG